MGTRIFYFSATGNSLQIARNIASEIESAVVLPIAGSKINKSVGGAREIIGFVFPVYFNGLPRLVKRFIENLDISPNTYCFAIANSGGTRSNSLGTLDDILISKNLRLSFADEIKMPSNYIIAHPLPDKVQIENLIAKATIKTKKIAKSISNYELKPVKHKAKLWSKIVNYIFLYKNASQWDEKFRVTKECAGCGLCAKVCPVKNIKMKNRLPVWQHSCEKCLACIHWCPNAAIEYGKNTIERTRYRNPNIKAEDIINELGGVENE